MLLTLAQSARVRGAAGDPLPEVWQALADKDTRFLRGQLCLVAAGPGTGKSAFVLNYALKSEVSCLYFSADSDAYIQLSRAISLLGDIDTYSAGNLARNGSPEQISGIIGDVPVRFSYEASPTLDHIEQQLMAYEELYGDYPELIVVDNALDVVLDDDSEGYSSLDNLMSWLHDLARNTSACVVVLHHVTGTYNDADKPVPLSGIKGQIGRVPEMILTLHKEVNEGFADILKVSTVKNRGQKADPSGYSYVELEFDGDKMNIKDYNNGASSSGWADNVTPF